MKLLALVSVIALTAATGAFAQSAPPLANENPNNCSPALPNCATDQGGSSNKTPRNAEGTGANARMNEQQGAMPAGTGAGASNGIKGGTTCPPGESACAPAGNATDRGNASGSASRGAPGNN